MRGLAIGAARRALPRSRRPRLASAHSHAWSGDANSAPITTTTTKTRRRRTTTTTTTTRRRRTTTAAATISPSASSSASASSSSAAAAAAAAPAAAAFRWKKRWLSSASSCSDTLCDGGGSWQEHLSLLSVAQLKELLRRNGLPVSARSKSALVQRIIDSHIVVDEHVQGLIRQALDKKQAVREKKLQRKAWAAAARAAQSQRTYIPRSATPAPPLLSHDGLVSILTWNVAGLRGFLKRDDASTNLRKIISDYSVDIVCLQETKLQECHVEDVARSLLETCFEDHEEPHGVRHDRTVDLAETLSSLSSPWQFHFATSQSRKGYSGVATIWNSERILVDKVFSGNVEPEGDEEGRSITLRARTKTAASNAEHEVVVVNCYVPNSGEGLKRLDYRINKWDPAFAAHVAAEAEIGQSSTAASTTIVVGDFNVAVEDVDHFDAGTPQSRRYPGRTPEEKASAKHHFFTPASANNGESMSPPIWADAFRECYPSVSGVFSYWSQRSRNRPFNRGLRIDTCLVDATT